MVRTCLLFLLTAALTATEPPRVWVCPNGATALDLARPWPAGVRSRLHGVKLYIGTLTRSSDDELAALAGRVRDDRLPVTVEVGGLLHQDWGDRIGERSAEIEAKGLRRWLAAGGRIDALDLDGPERRAMGLGFKPEEAAKRDPAQVITDPAVIGREIDDYLTAMRAVLPTVRFNLLVNFPNWGWKGGPAPSLGKTFKDPQKWGDYHVMLTGVLAVVQRDEPRLSALTVDSPYGYTIRAKAGARPADQGEDWWVTRLADLAATVRAHHLTYGLILNCELGGKTSDQAFHDNTLAFARLVHGRLTLDDVYVQSWYEYPKTVLGAEPPALLGTAVAVRAVWEQPAP